MATQFLGYGFAGICTNFLVHNSYMWWPGTLVDVSFYRYSEIHVHLVFLFCPLTGSVASFFLSYYANKKHHLSFDISRAIHVTEKRPKGQLTRLQFFLIVAVSSFAYHIVPIYFFPSITALSFICWIWKDSVTAQQIGSGQKGLGLGSFALDWMTTTSYYGSPLATPMFVICNMFIGFVIKLYVIAPISYWTNAYSAKRFPIFSQEMFDADGQKYNISRIIDEKLQLDEAAYNNYSKLYLSVFYPYSYGFSFACLTSSISHLALYHGRSMWNQVKKAYEGKEEDIHSRLMKQNYESIPQWWFYLVLFSMAGLAILTCQAFNEQVQLFSWGFLIVFAMISILLFPNAVLTATTNTSMPVHVFSEMLVGYLSPGKPIANMAFKIYGTLAVSTATDALSSFKLGHYMKIPPKSMFLIQIIGTALSVAANFGTGWWIFSSIPHILPVWILSQMYPEKKWIQLIHMPVIFSVGAVMPPASAVNIWPWIVVGTIFNYVVFKKYKGWWARYNYVLSSALDIGAAFVAVLASILQVQNVYGISWWGLAVDDHCPLATCPTEPDIVVEGCPVFK
ncbi:oligopeptide transporter 1-like [Elaeis guineensis]|uniref:oligopeptide transporter 1-like n=1 Tax=Elaeis guineensis var. tenera TaxID=51953 RepID=UPI003C6D970F